MEIIIKCMLTDPYYCLLALGQFVSWILFFIVTIAAMKHVLFDDSEEECYER